MNFNNVVFHKSVWLNSNDILLDEKKEIVFVWRSNVWKSSIMNTIFNKKDLVKTSAKPGKTKMANMFLLENKYYFTDLPWYGFAKLWKDMKEELDWLISWYLEEKAMYIKMVVMLIDSKLWAQSVDLDMYKYIFDLWLPVTIVLSKIDKLWNQEIVKSIKHAQEQFFGQQILTISNTKRIWIRDLEKIITKSLLDK